MVLSINSTPLWAKTREYHLSVLHWLKDAIRWKWLQVWASSDRQLHDSTPANASCLLYHLLCSFLVKHHITQVTHPPYSSDFMSCDFWLFPKLKSPLKRKWFQNVREIQENMTGQLMAIPMNDFAECFEQWKRHWENCVRSQGAYFEGDWGVIVLYTMFLVSCIFFNKCTFSYYMAGYFLNHPCIHPQ